MAAMFVFLFFDVDPVKSFPLALGARKVTQQLGKLVEANVKFISSTSWISGITDQFIDTEGPHKDYGVDLVRRLLESGKSAEEIAWSQILPTAGATVANQAQVVCVPIYTKSFLKLTYAVHPNPRLLHVRARPQALARHR